MSEIQEILQSDKKPKEKVSLLANKVKKNLKLIDELIEYFQIGTKAEKGNCIEVLEYVSQDNPDIVLPYVDFVIEHINEDAPKIKWETARVIGNLAQKFPEKAAKAVPKLLDNTKDKGTVVRWSVAFALTEIAKNSPKSQKALTAKFQNILKAEKNNGVKNVYLKTLKALNK